MVGRKWGALKGILNHAIFLSNHPAMVSNRIPSSIGSKLMQSCMIQQNKHFVLGEYHFEAKAPPLDRMKNHSIRVSWRANCLPFLENNHDQNCEEVVKMCALWEWRDWLLISSYNIISLLFMVATLCMVVNQSWFNYSGVVKEMVTHWSIGAKS